MPDNETNEDANKRPKRRAAQRTYVSYENTSVWSEDKDLKRALLASLQDAKRSASNSKSNSVFSQKTKKALTLEKINRSDVYSKLKTQSQLVSKVCQPLSSDNNISLLSLAAHRRARVSAQRKFAQSSGFSGNSPVSTPIKTGFVASSNVVELFPNQKPNTEDFLTFLCLRRSPILPPNLDFIRLNAVEDKKRETDSENISNDELDQNNDKYTSCRITAGADRRGSASSAVSKATSLSSRASLQISNRKKCEIERIDNKSQNSVKPKRTQSLNSESGLKNIGSNPNQNTKQSQSKRSLIESNESENKTFESLKEKYKLKRIEKKGSNPSKTVIEKQTKDQKNVKTEGIQTRQQLRIHSYRQKEGKPEEKVKSKKSKSSERVLRSHHSDSVFAQSLPKVDKMSNILVRNTNAKSYRNGLVCSQIGIRPKTRKAKPVVPLIDYYFDSEFESEVEKKDIKSERKKGLNSTQLKSKNWKNDLKDNKNVKIRKSISEEKEIRSPGRPKGSTKLANKCKTGQSLDLPRIQTRSSRPLSPPKDNKDLERERLIKQQIIAIERKHKRLRRCPSDDSLHSSSSSSSSSSSESLPNSVSSSSSINNTRLTRSLEHLKKIRDIAAKLKREQNKKADKDEDRTDGKPKKNEVSTNSSKKRSISIKENSNKRQNIVKSKKSANCVKDLKVNNKTKKAINKNVKERTERTVTRRVVESVVSATSDTDCDTEAPEGEDVMSELNGMNGTEEDSMASILGDDMERASIEMQDMAEDINCLLVNTSNNDLQYGSTEHIEGLMTSGFSAFTDETVSTAFRLQSDSHSEYNYVPQTDDMTTQTRSTVDASTNTTDDDIMASLSSDDTQTPTFDYNSKTTDSSVQTDPSID